jgi:hypothetical protein
MRSEKVNIFSGPIVFFIITTLKIDLLRYLSDTCLTTQYYVQGVEGCQLLSVFL